MVILVTTFLSASVFAAAPVSDVTMRQSNAQVILQDSSQVENKLQQLTRLLETRNKMQVRLQSQLDQLALEMSQMKGSIELFNHKLDQVESRQRNLYQLIDDLSAPAPVAATNDNAVGGDDKIAYEKAVDLVLVNKDFGQAVTAFEAFIIDHPQSNYIANSYYWLGQLLYKQKKRSEARTAFLTVVDKYPDSNKRADALYKIGFIDEYTGDIKSAKIFYTKVVSEFPDSSAAGLSNKRLASF